MLITLILTLAGAGLGVLLEEPVLYGVLGFLLGRIIVLDLSLDLLERELARLRRLMAEDWQRRHAGDSAAENRAEGVGKKPPVQVPAPVDGAQASVAAAAEVESALSHQTVRRGEEAAGTGPGAASDRSTGTETVPADPAPIRNLVEGLRDWLRSGNLFVRIGILLLFLGVGFLIKYAVDRDLLALTPEMRLAAIAAGAAFLLLLGWYLRKRRRDYALLLQGAAFGILYLDIYGAYQLYELVPAGAAFALLFLTGLAAAFLAVLQDARGLAWFGFAGGFLAPIVVSGGRDDHLILFSYFALLNGGVLAVAWFKSWRTLNLLGFAFTYGVAGLWGVLRYEPSRFATTEPFLVLFFLFYVAIAVLYALRQPPRFRGYIDATLVFGTPILTFAYQAELTRPFEYGIAWSAASIGVFYLVLALLLSRFGGSLPEKPRDEGRPRRRSHVVGLGLLAQAFLALGLLFISLAVPFALSGDETAAAWALQGAGLVWIGVRQRQAGARAFGLLLQAGAAAFLVAGHPYGTGAAFVNGFYLGAAMIGIAGCVSAYWLDREYPGKRSWEHGAGAVLMFWALAWWFGAGGRELARFYPAVDLPVGILVYAAVTVLAMEAAASLRPWALLHRVQAALPLAGIAALAAGLGVLDHPAEHGGIWAWPLYITVVWLVLYRVERRDAHPTLGWGHAAGGLLLAAVLEWEISWRLIEQAGWVQGWRLAAVAVVPVLLLQLVTRVGIWPLGRWRTAYALVLGSVLTTAIGLWAILSVRSAGGSGPFSWLPLLNPLDMMLAVGVITLFQWWVALKERFGIRFHRDQEGLVWVFLGALAFLWINLVLLRAMHHWWGVDYAPGPLFRSDAVQMALSVLWGLVGVALLLAARVRTSRGLWVAGALILAAVVVKLFLVDLAASGTVERIVSFIAIGGLLMGIGWFSPLPPTGGAETDEGGGEPGSA